MADNLLEIRNLRVNFRLGNKQTFNALKGVNFDVPRNSVVALVGESGSGKSVSALTVMDLLPHDNSEVEGGSHIVFDGQDLLPDARELGTRVVRRRQRFAETLKQGGQITLNPSFRSRF